MFKFLEGMAPDVLAVEATGQVTHEDYRSGLIPRAEAMMAKGQVKMLYIIGAEFTGFDLEAMWDDGAFGLKHWHDFSHIAVVTDHAWMRAMVSMFAPFIRGKVRLFELCHLQAAKDWIGEIQTGSAAT